MITTKTIYMTKGKEFDSYKKAVTYREDLLGYFIDKGLGFQVGPKEKLKFLDYMLVNKEKLIDLLSFGLTEPEYEED